MRISLLWGCALPLILASGCHYSNGAAPRERVIDATPAGISQLFLDQCVRQIDAEWARAEVARRIKQCGFFDSGDCKARNEGGVDWQVNAGNENAINVSLWWKPRNYWEDNFGRVQYDYTMPSHKVNCGVDLPENLSNLVKPVSDIIRRNGYRVSAPTDNQNHINEKMPYIVIVHRNPFPRCSLESSGSNASSCPTGVERVDSRQSWSIEYRYY